MVVGRSHELLGALRSGPPTRRRGRRDMASVQEFFEGLPGRVSSDRIAGMNNTYIFEIEGAGTWTVAIADGSLTVTEGASGGDVTISASEESFEKIVAGEQNPTTAYMTGKLKIKGDMGAAMKLQKLF
jgi:alkyl sulfatase BDS1-like metallo-beta-lactamase superfamily hydrolase